MVEDCFIATLYLSSFQYHIYNLLLPQIRADFASPIYVTRASSLTLQFSEASSSLLFNSPRFACEEYNSESTEYNTVPTFMFGRMYSVTCFFLISSLIMIEYKYLYLARFLLLSF